jgi:CBS domain-containing protein
MKNKRKSENKSEKQTGLPGAGAGRKDRVGRSGVYPMSGPPPPADAEMVWPGGWGQGKRGAAGYEDHGESEVMISRVVPEKCRDIMTKDPVFCQASDSVTIAAKLMLKHNIGALPVIGTLPEDKLVGIVTDRDLAMKVLAAALDPRTTTVFDVMSKPVVTCSPDDDYARAVDLMERHQIKRIVAVDRRGRPVGMISEADVALRIPDEKIIEELIRSVDQPL